MSPTRVPPCRLVSTSGTRAVHVHRTNMPKHALVPSRDTPCSTPGVGGLPAPPSSSAPVVLSNEVLLRSKIAQLDSKREAASGVTGLRKPFPTSSSGGVGRTAVKHAVGGGTFDGKTRHLSDAAEDHSDFGRGPGKREVSTSNFRGGRGLAKNEEKLLRQFETQVGRASRNPNASNAQATTSENERQQPQWHGFTSEGVQVLREMYGEQVRAARLMSKQADVLASKTQKLETSSEGMRTEAESCAHESARLEQAAAKLHGLSVELDGRRRDLLETRKAAAAEHACKRKDMNSSLNSVVTEMSAKIKQQEEERIAQDEENSQLRTELQALLQRYDDQKNASEKDLKHQDEEIATITERLQGLTSSAQASLEREKGLRTDVVKLVAGEDVLRRRVGEHATRLKRQEEGLQTHLESIQGLQVEEGKLNVSVARLSMEKRALLLRAGFVDASDEGAVSGEIDVTKISEVVLEKRETVARLECRKDQLQKRCREMQAERKRVTAELESIATGATSQEADKDTDA